MVPLTDHSIHSMLVTLTMVGLSGGAILLMVGGLRRTRPGFAIGTAALAAVGLRVVAAGLISLTSVARSLRGGDEITFLDHAQRIVDSPPARANGPIPC